MDGQQSVPKGYSNSSRTEDYMMGLRSLYLDYLDQEIKSFRSLLATKDLGSIRDLGHRLKGSGGSYGFNEISALGETIQYLEDDADWGDIEILFHRLEEMYQEEKER